MPVSKLRPAVMKLYESIPSNPHDTELLIVSEHALVLTPKPRSI